MRCTQQEVHSILERWYEERTPLLLDIKFIRVADLLRMRGRTGGVDPDHFHFASPTMPVPLLFVDMDFMRTEIITGNGDIVASAFRVSRLTIQISGDTPLHSPILQSQAVPELY
ncbi:hypothetical protein GCM10011507_01370 [Edaphobacter acidisoli]|uniref:Uncharacterized protein n=1 Tax=Edaphobacter acidisoli TaxID=2040573 RepID=A0A916RE89_9BACT|nr:hypothetical protein GCM10011507_01370 [Edaphobacter acidisoli]